MGKTIYLSDRQIKAFHNAVAQYGYLAESDGGSEDKEILKDYEELVKIQEKLCKI